MILFNFISTLSLIKVYPISWSRHYFGTYQSTCNVTAAGNWWT